MKIAVEGNEAIVSGGGETGQFQIKASAKAFSILSSGLYSDKILAIVRELSCNAYDAQVEAGNADRPFDVHLPNSLTPEFKIRDYGIGLDHDGVMNVYTTYFESTKQDSNDYIGALGLGSKSPFSYTENFTVTAIKDGVKRIYAAIIENGFPSIVKFGDDVDTNEHDGVEVKFAVKKHDFTKFAEAAQKVYRWFDVTPNIGGNQVKITKQPLKHVQIIPGVDIREKGGGYYDNGRPLARQGNVVYPLAPNAEDIDRDLRSLLDAPFVIDFPIGSLDVAASREELSYINLTNASINARLREVQNGLADYVERELKTAKTDWERLQVIANMSDNTFAAIIKGMVEDKKRKLVEHSLMNYQYNRPSLIINDHMEKAGNYEIVNYTVRTRNHNTGAVRLSRSGKHTHMVGNGNDRKIVDNRYTIAVGDGTLFFINDTGKKNALGRVREYLNGQVTYNSDIFVINASGKKSIDAFKKDAGFPPSKQIVLCSECPEPVRATRGQGSSAKINLLVLEYDQYGRNYDGSRWSWKEERESLKDFADGDETLYVPLKNRTVLKPNDVEMGKGSFFNMIDAITDCGLVDRKRAIVGVRKSAIDDLTSDYVNLFDHIKSQIAKVSKKRLMENVRRASILDHAQFKKDDLRKIAGGLGKKHPISVLVEKVESLSQVKGLERPSNVQRLNRIASYINMSDDEFDVDTDKLSEQGAKEWDKATKQYPIFNWLSTGYREKSAKMQMINDVIDYIKLVDKAS